MIYANWHEVYEDSVYKLSSDTWSKGIILELEKLNINSGTILDAGCGTGIGSDSLRDIGNYSIIGIDKSMEMLGKSEGKYDSLLQRDISDFEVPSVVDVIVSGFDTLNYLNYYQLSSFFSSAFKALKNEGYIIFDYSSPKLLEFDWKDLQYEIILSNSILKWKHNYDDNKKYSKTIISNYINGEKSWEENHIQFSYTPHDILKLFGDLNLHIINVRNLDNNYFSPESNTHVFLIQKKL